MNIDHGPCDPKYGHICRSQKAADAATLIVAAWRSAGEAGMSKAQTIAYTELTNKWFNWGRVYIRMHAAAMLNHDEPYTYDPRANGGHGAYHLNASDESILDYLAQEFRADAVRLERRMKMALSKVEARSMSSSFGQQWLRQLVNAQERVIDQFNQYSVWMENPQVRELMLREMTDEASRVDGSVQAS